MGMTTGNVGTLTPRQVAIVALLALVLAGLIAWIMFRPAPTDTSATAPTGTATTPAQDPAASASSAPVAGDRLGLVTHVPVTTDPAEFGAAFALASCSWDSTAHTREDMAENLKRFIDPDGSGRRQAGDHRTQMRANLTLSGLEACGVPAAAGWRGLRSSQMYTLVEILDVRVDDEHADWGFGVLVPENVGGPDDRHYVSVDVRVQERTALADDPTTAGDLQGPDPDSIGYSTATISLLVTCAGPVDADPAEPMCAVNSPGPRTGWN